MTSMAEREAGVLDRSLSQLEKGYRGGERGEGAERSSTQPYTDGTRREPVSLGADGGFLRFLRRSSSVFSVTFRRSVGEDHRPLISVQVCACLDDTPAAENPDVLFELAVRSADLLA